MFWKRSSSLSLAPTLVIISDQFDYIKVSSFEVSFVIILKKFWRNKRVVMVQLMGMGAGREIPIPMSKKKLILHSLMTLLVLELLNICPIFIFRSSHKYERRGGEKLVYQIQPPSHHIWYSRNWNDLIIFDTLKEGSDYLEPWYQFVGLHRSNK